MSTGTLTGVLDGFDSFDELMDDGKNNRLLKDKLKVAEMTKNTERLASFLDSQIAARREMNQQLQKLCETKIADFYSSFDELYAEKNMQVEERLDALNERITALDAHFSRGKARINAEIEERTRELMTMLATFHQLFAEECALRAKRETAIKLEMDSHEIDVAERFKLEDEARESVRPHYCLSYDQPRKIP